MPTLAGDRTDGTPVAGSRAGLVALVPRLRAFARSLTGGDVHLADDLVQDTILNALQAQDQSPRAPTSRPRVSPSSATASAA